MRSGEMIGTREQRTLQIGYTRRQMQVDMLVPSYVSWLVEEINLW
jgi:hypothetical protein